MNWESNILFEDQRTSSSIELVCSSGIGMRESQQDAAYVYADDRQVFAVVCDGMGGLSGGQLASRTAIELLIEFFHKTKEQDVPVTSRWIELLQRVDDIVYSLKDGQGKRLGAGTTLAAISIRNDMLYWLSVGDSHIYVSRGEEFVQVTEDHIYALSLDQQLRRGAISKEKYDSEMERGDALISFVGMGGLLLIDANEDGLALQPNDRIVVCSDGVYRTANVQQLKDYFSNSKTIGEAGQSCIRTIEKERKFDQDNYTLVAVEVK